MCTNNELVALATKIVKLIGNAKQHKDKVLQNIDSDLHARFVESTSFMPEDTKLSQRVAHGLTGIDRMLICVVCGNTHMRIYPPSQRDYCCKGCYFSDTKAMKQRVSVVDQTARVKKMAHTNKVKYGYEFNSQRPDVKKLLSKSKLERTNPEAVDRLADKLWLEEQYAKQTSVEISNTLNVHYSTVLFHLRKHGIEITPYANTSAVERSINQFILDSGARTTTSTRNILTGNREIDIYVPEKHLAIEVNGLYWHSSTDFTNSAKHLTKTEECLSNGIRLIHISDEKWFTKPDVVKSMLLNRLGMSQTRIHARQCTVRSVDPSTSNEFINRNHINGTANANKKYGLYHNDVLVLVMTFSKSRYSKMHEWELIRLCSAHNTVIVGGASKVFQHFIREQSPISIMTYADRQYGEGHAYPKLGFKFSHITKPGYSWTDGNKTYNRINFQKHKLHKLLDVYSDSLTERENMINNGYRLYFDCGHNVYEWSQQ
jgi:hypothetical protein